MSNWEQIGNVWVDSGQILIADPCYALSKDDYNANVDYMNQPHKLKRGVINSGWGGDGDFPVYVKKNDKGLVLEMKIVFNKEDTRDTRDTIYDDTFQINLENKKLKAEKEQLELERDVFYLRYGKKARLEDNDD